MNTKYFETITLDKMDKVKLMNRRDTKYWFHIALLSKLLFEIKDDYYILDIKNNSVQPYLTTYFDTDDNQMFIAHHNGKLNRFKIRRRTYLSSDISFLEVKFKNNKGRTIKERINSENHSSTFSPEDNDFIKNKVPFKTSDLHPSLTNRFKRIMLVSKNFNERCTIDINLEFESEDMRTRLDNLVIVELKSDGKPDNSPLAEALRKRRIKSSGFSKYCMGRVVTDNNLKQNAFKPKLRSMQKLVEIEKMAV